MKLNLILTTFFSLSLSALVQANCDRPIDESKVMLFVDMNNSGPEIEVAKRAACARGQRLSIIPTNYREWETINARAAQTQAAMTRCTSTRGFENCPTERSANNTSTEELRLMEERTGRHQTLIDQELARIKEAGGKVVNFTISGHDGGGIFSGYKGEISRDELGELFAKYADVNGVQSVLLLGCYTGTAHEVMGWQGVFPQTKIIAGYDGIAPASDKPAGHQYLDSLLRNEESLIAPTTPEDIRRAMTSNISSLGILNAGLFLNPLCEEEGATGFHYGSQTENPRRLTPLSLSECQSKAPELRAIVVELNEYLNGDKPVPSDTRTGALRALYNRARSIEHCAAEAEVAMDTNVIFNLLFNEDVKKNFAEFYKDDLAEAQTVLAGINSVELLANAETDIKKLEDLVSAQEGLQSLIDTDFEAFKSRYAEVTLEAMRRALSAKGQNPEEVDTLLENMRKTLQPQIDALTPALAREEMNTRLPALRSSITEMRAIAQSHATPEALSKLWIPTASNLATKSQKELLENIHNLTTLMTVPGLSTVQKNTLSWTINTTSRHLQYMANPFSWHEFTGSPEAPEHATRLADHQAY